MATTPQRDIFKALRSFILEQILYNKPDVTLEPDTSLVESGLVDSLGLFMIISFVEDNLGVTIAPEDIVLENFETLLALEQMVFDRQQV